VWLEAYFDRYGWVPIVGTPPKAQPNLDTNPKKHNDSIQTSDRFNLQIYVPVRDTTLQATYTVVRYWAYRVVPTVVLLVLLLIFYPGAVKAARRWRRRRWARGLGLPQRLAVAYAELRDTAHDLNLGDVTMTPLEFVAASVEDAEHRELAWLVSRSLWGDLSRDLRLEDVEAAEEMVVSVTRRMRRATPAFNRIVGFAARASLRDPYSDQIPNLWPDWHPWRRVRGVVAAPLRQARRAVRLPGRLRLPRAVAAALAAVGLSSCAASSGVTTGHHQALPSRLVPAKIADLSFKEEPSAEQRFLRPGPAAIVTAGHVWTIHAGPVVQGDVQIAAFRDGYSARLRRVRQGVLQSIGAHNFQLTRLGDQKVYVAQLPGEQILMWFSADGRYYELMDARSQFTQAQDVFVSLLSYQQGGSATVVTTSTVPKPDPRQGGEQ
jgi:hypothetical protein